MTERLTKDDIYRICASLDFYANDLLRTAERGDGWSEQTRQSMAEQAEEVLETLRKMAPKLAKTDIQYFASHLIA